MTKNCFKMIRELGGWVVHPWLTIKIILKNRKSWFWIFRNFGLQKFFQPGLSQQYLLACVACLCAAWVLRPRFPKRRGLTSSGCHCPNLVILTAHIHLRVLKMALVRWHWQPDLLRQKVLLAGFEPALVWPAFGCFPSMLLVLHALVAAGVA